MDHILKIIEEKHLTYLTFTEMVEALYKFTGINQTKLKQYVTEMIEDGLLMYDDNDMLSPTGQKGLIRCRLIGNKKGFAFAEQINKEKDELDIFIPKNAINGAIHGDFVLVRVVDRPYDSNPEGKVVQILKRNTENVVGVVEKYRNGYIFVPDENRYEKEIRFIKGGLKTAKDGDKVVAKLVVSSHKVEAVVREVLGKADTARAEQLAIIRSYNLKEDFDDATINEATRIRNTVNDKDIEGRRDFRHLRTFTVDGADARDFDDAISIERLKNGHYRLGVHIADVTHYVKSGSALDKEAFARGTSVYFPDMVLPMLPVELSNGICSLNPKVDRLTLSVMMELDAGCQVVSSEICEAVINSKARMTYDEVTEILEGDMATRSKYVDFVDDILLVNDLSNKLEKIRHDRGEIRFDIPECFVEMNDLGEIVNISKREHKDSHEIIESFMILCNEVVAKTYFNKLPFVYRVHEKPDEFKLNNLVKFIEWQGLTHKINANDLQPAQLQQVLESIDDPHKKQVISKMMLRSMMKARYAPECLGHFGLASTFYCHFTSPIRRYPDLCIHRIIKSAIKGGLSDEQRAEYRNFVELASEQSSVTEKTAEEVERAVDDYKKSLYMTKFIGEEFDGTVSGVNDFGIFVELENTVEGLVRLDYLPIDAYTYNPEKMSLIGSKHSYMLGDDIRVVVLGANPKLRQVSFGIAGIDYSVTSKLNDQARKENKNIKIKSNKYKNENKLKNNKKSKKYNKK